MDNVNNNKENNEMQFKKEGQILIFMTDFTMLE